MVALLIAVLGIFIGIPVLGIFLSSTGGTRHSHKNNDSSFFTDHHDNHWTGFNHDLSSPKNRNYDPFDNHWESSSDWKDEDNDGYDDRDDGFWNEREF